MDPDPLPAHLASAREALAAAAQACWWDDPASEDAGVLADLAPLAPPGARWQLRRQLTPRGHEVATRVRLLGPGGIMGRAEVLGPSYGGSLAKLVEVLPGWRGQGLGGVMLAAALRAGAQWAIVDASDEPAVRTCLRALAVTDIHRGRVLTMHLPGTPGAQNRPALLRGWDGRLPPFPLPDAGEAFPADRALAHTLAGCGHVPLAARMLQAAALVRATWLARPAAARNQDLLALLAWSSAQAAAVRALEPLRAELLALGASTAHPELAAEIARALDPASPGTWRDFPRRLARARQGG